MDNRTLKELLHWVDRNYDTTRIGGAKPQMKWMSPAPVNEAAATLDFGSLRALSRMLGREQPTQFLINEGHGLAWGNQPGRLFGD